MSATALLTLPLLRPGDVVCMYADGEMTPVWPMVSSAKPAPHSWRDIRMGPVSLDYVTHADAGVVVGLETP